MTYEIPGFSFSLVAAADLRAFQYCFVNADNTAAGSKCAAPSAGGQAIGILQNKPNSGEVGTVVVSGISKCKVGTGNVTAGAIVKTLADGTITAVGTSAIGVGIALASGNAGEYVPVLLLPQGSK